MEKMNFKRTLWGYSKQSVLDYILEVDGEYKRKISDAANAQKSMQNAIEKLKAEVEGFAEETDRLVDEMSEKDEKLAQTISENEKLCQQIEALKNENSSLKEQNEELKKQIENKKNGFTNHYSDGFSGTEANEITGMIFEAKRFANELKRKAEREYIKACTDNLAKLEIQKQRTADYTKRIDALCKTVHNLCDNLDGELSCVRRSLERAASEDVLGAHDICDDTGAHAESIRERIKRLGL